MKDQIKALKTYYKLFGIWYFLPSGWRFRWNDFYWNYIRPIFNPQLQRYRKVIPKTWVDLTDLIVICNLEFIKGFYEDEFIKDTVDWSATPEHKAFAQWLKKAYKYVTVERPKLLKDIENAYPEENWDRVFEKSVNEDGLVKWEWKGGQTPKLTYKKMYGKVELLEKRLEDKDTKFITEMIKNRAAFWT